MNFPVADTDLVPQLNSKTASAGITAQGETLKPQSNFADILATLPNPNDAAKELADETPVPSGAEEPETDSDPTLLDKNGQETAATSRSVTEAVEATSQPKRSKELPQAKVAFDVPQRVDGPEQSAPAAHPPQSTPELLHGLTRHQPAKIAAVWPVTSEPVPAQAPRQPPERSATSTPQPRAHAAAENIAPLLSALRPHAVQKTNSVQPSDAQSVETVQESRASVSDTSAITTAKAPRLVPAMPMKTAGSETSAAIDNHPGSSIANKAPPSSPRSNPQVTTTQEPVSGAFTGNSSTRTAESRSTPPLPQQTNASNAAVPEVKPVKLRATHSAVAVMIDAQPPQISGQTVVQQGGSADANPALNEGSLKATPTNTNADLSTAQTSKTRNHDVTTQAIKTPTRQPVDVQDQNLTELATNTPTRQPVDVRDQNLTEQVANTTAKQPAFSNEGTPTTKSNYLAERPQVPLPHEPRLTAPQPTGLPVTKVTTPSKTITSSAWNIPQAIETKTPQNYLSTQSTVPLTPQPAIPPSEAGAAMAYAKELPIAQLAGATSQTAPSIAVPQPSAPPPTQTADAEQPILTQQQPASSGQGTAPSTAAVQIGVTVNAQAPAPAQNRTGQRTENVGRSADTPPTVRSTPAGVTTTNQNTPTNTWAPATPPLVQAGLPSDQLAKAEQIFSLLAPSEPGDILNWESVRQLAPQPGTQQPLRADLAPHIARQMAEAMPSAAQRPVEIALSPAELGRVRMSIASDDGSVTVNIIAERPETLDLMRRHIDQLGQTFRSMGYDQITFAFGQGADTGGQAASDEGAGGAGTARPSQDDLTTEQIATETLNPLNAGTTGVDIRL